MSSFVKISAMPVPAPTLYRWHMRPGAFMRLKPPWENVSLVGGSEEVADGSRAIIEIRPGPGPIPVIRWTAEHFDVVENRSFSDRQVSGPFARWCHQHIFEEVDEQSSRLEDRIEFALPLLMPGLLVEGKLERLFQYRHDLTRGDLEIGKRLADSFGSGTLSIALAGDTSDPLAAALKSFLTTQGHRIVDPDQAGIIIQLVRSKNWSRAFQELEERDGSRRLVTVYCGRGEPDQESLQELRRCLETEGEGGAVAILPGLVLDPYRPASADGSGTIYDSNTNLRWISQADLLDTIYTAAADLDTGGLIYAHSPDMVSASELGKYLRRGLSTFLPGPLAEMKASELNRSILSRSAGAGNLSGPEGARGIRNFRHPTPGSAMVAILGVTT